MSVTRNLSLPTGALSITCSIDSFFDVQVIDEMRYRTLPARQPFRIELGQIGSSEYPTAGRTDTYRRRMLSRGLHLGHNLGPVGDAEAQPGRIAVGLSGGTAESYRRVLWTYALKLYLSLTALNCGLLHVKATTVINSRGEIILLVGRGGGGKSTLARELAQRGFQIAGNTHALIDRTHAWAINSWSRLRTQSGEAFEVPLPPDATGDGIVCHVVLVEHNRDGRHELRELSAREALGFSMQFVAATMAYDLKEDLMDAWNDTRLALRCFNDDIEHMHDLLNAVPVHFLSADLADTRSRAAALGFFERC